MTPTFTVCADAAPATTSAAPTIPRIPHLIVRPPHFDPPIRLPLSPAARGSGRGGSAEGGYWHDERPPWTRGAAPSLCLSPRGERGRCGEALQGRAGSS